MRPLESHDESSEEEMINWTRRVCFTENRVHEQREHQLALTGNINPWCFYTFCPTLLKLIGIIHVFSLSQLIYNNS